MQLYPMGTKKQTNMTMKVDTKFTDKTVKKDELIHISLYP